MNPHPHPELVSARLPTRSGEFTIHPLAGGDEAQAPVAIGMGDVAAAVAPLVRLHSECLTGDVLHSLRCDCGFQLDAALSMIAAERVGLLVYLRQEGRGIGIVNKIRAYALQDAGFDTIDANTHLGFEPDERGYAAAGEILRRLGISRIRLLTNNPGKRAALAGLGVEVVDRMPLVIAPNPHNEAYLRTKKLRDGHSF
jgi:GTP cyclohydrolase II